MSNNLDTQYINLLKDIMENGTRKKTRNGETISVFGRTIRHKMSEGFPLLTTKKMYWKGIVTELLWFLRGDTNIKFLVDNGCHIWDDDAYRAYVTQWNKNFEGYEKYEHQNPLDKENFIKYIAESTPEMIKRIGGGDLGPVYGKQWRNWSGKTENELYDEYLSKIRK